MSIPALKLLSIQPCGTSPGQNGRPRQLAFTIVELLVVIAIVGILTALLLPAIQASRESARLLQCLNHLKQLGVAVSSHEAAHRHYPTGGWGCSWTGDPDRGTGERQPGGWLYNILPYIEQGKLHEKGAGVQNITDKYLQAAEVIQTPLSLMNCPTRRQSRVYPNVLKYTLYNAAPRPAYVARADYAINAGDSGNNTITLDDTFNGFCGPATLIEGDTTFIWPKKKNFTGVSYVRSTVIVSQVLDGTNKTYLIGESHLSVHHYEHGTAQSDRGHMYSGMAPDTVRLTFEDLVPRKDDDSTNTQRFGSAHGAGCNFVFCDGSARTVGFDIDRKIHKAYGNRKDGAPVD